MDVRGSNADAIFRRPRDRHLFAACVALGVSLGLHVWVAETFPDLHVGRLADVEQQARYPSVRMEDVRHDVVDRTQRPPRLRPEDPSRSTPTMIDATALIDSPATRPSEMKNVEASALAGESAALAEPRLPDRQKRWEPRQDLVQIEEQIYSEKVSALPRRYASRVDRQAKAPDVTLPVERVEREGLSGLQDLTSAETRQQVRPLEPAADTMKARLSEGATAVPLGRPSQGALLGETPDAITGMAAVEELLNLDVAVYRPPDEPDFGYFRIQIRRKGESELPILPKDVVLLQDCSESMTQAKVDNCKEGLLRWVDGLGPEDRLEIMGFREDAYRCFGAVTNVTEATKARARWFIGEMVSRGKTDVYASLRELMSVPRDPARPVVAVLITDGRPTTGVVDSSEIIESFTRTNFAERAVFCVGGGRRVNRFLLDLLGYRNRGDSLIVEDRHDIPDAVEAMSKELSRPVLADLACRFSGMPAGDVHPATLTHLYLDRPLVIYGRFPAKLEKTALQVVGRAGAEKHDMVFAIDLARVPEGDDTLRTQWVWHRIYSLIGRHIATREAGLMDEVRSLAGRYGLDVPYESEAP